MLYRSQIISGYGGPVNSTVCPTHLSICFLWFSTSRSKACFSDSLSCSFAICSSSFGRKQKHEKADQQLLPPATRGPQPRPGSELRADRPHQPTNTPRPGLPAATPSRQLPPCGPARRPLTGAAPAREPHLDAAAEVAELLLHGGVELREGAERPRAVPDVLEDNGPVSAARGGHRRPARGAPRGSRRPPRSPVGGSRRGGRAAVPARPP